MDRTGLHTSSRILLAVFILALAGLGRPAFALVLAPQPRVRFDQSPPQPDVPSQVLIGENFKFRVRFRNLPSFTTVPGYGTFIDVVIDAGGANPAKSCPCDGVTFVQANMIGVNGGPVPLTNVQNLAFPCGSSSTSLNHPYGGVLPVIVPAGAQLVTLELPFGSFDPTQPEVIVEVTAHVSNLADANHPLKISARGGFRYGADPLNNAPPDWPVLSDLITFGNPPQPTDQQTDSTLWAAQAQTTPVVMTVSKKYLGPEDETATGPNFVHQYQITLDIAAGQTLSNITVTDHLPNNMAFHQMVSSSPPCFTVVASPGPNVASSPNDLILNCPSTITGVPGPDATFVFEFFIPQFDANGNPILSPTSCNPATSTNDIVAEGNWTPLDPCDTGPLHVVSDVTHADHVLADKCLAIQKTVADLTGGPPAHPIPGDTLEYTLNFQLSDFKTAGGLKVRDVISDGQSLVGSPTMTVSDQCGTTTGTVPSPAMTVTTLACGTGAPPPRTELVIDVSAAMSALAASTVPRHVAGVLTGGWALTPTTAIPAIGTIKFRTTINDAYQCSVPSPHDVFVDKDDPLTDTVTITGDIRANGGSCTTTPSSLGFQAQDDSKAALLIATDFLVKSIYAVTRGSNQICGPQTTACPAKPQVVPGDLVTFRLTKTIYSSDFENLTIQDWLSLPKFLVAGTTFSNTMCGIPAVGAACLGPSNTLSVVPTYAADPNTNSLTFDYHSSNDPTNQPHTIDLLFTRAVTNTPEADGLFNTNQAQECESNTFGTIFCQSAIAQVEVREPSLKLTKGIVTATNPNAVFSPSQVGPVPFHAVGTSCPRFSGTINSTNLASTPINSDVSNVDANDCVTFAIVVENTGGSAAYDIKLRESFPPGPLDIPDCFEPDFTTLCVTDGTGTPLPFTTGAGFHANLPIALQNPLPGTSSPSGTNIAVITFDACVVGNITPHCCDNFARIDNYASTPGGPNFVDGGFGGPFQDTARLCVLPNATKSLVATSEGHTSGNQAAIGEIVRYHFDLVVSESNGANTYQLQDLSPPA